MSLEKATIVWTGKQFRTMNRKGLIKVDNEIQRGLVWSKDIKTKFIESIILGYPIPPIYARRIVGDEKKEYDLLDGKQRLTTLVGFLNDEWELGTLPNVKYYDDELDVECEEDVTGLKFSELPEVLRHEIETSTLNVIYFDNLTKEEEIEMFKRLNNGKALSPKSRALASCINIGELMDIGSHKVLCGYEDEDGNTVKGMLSDKAIQNKNHAILVMKIWAMLFKDITTVDFSSKHFNPVLENAVVEYTEKNIINEVLDYVFEVHENLLEREEKKVAKKLYTETHLVSLVPYFQKAIVDGISEDDMADWILTFYGTEKGASTSEKYNEACSNGIAKNASILARCEALDDSFRAFFAEDAEDETANETETTDDTEKEVA